ncbi:DNA mismatch repair protein MutT [Rhodopirellula sallentina]|uniref:MutT/nudix family protein n=1 Tax=Rhodopirellula sallentina SM41 TaxID=1263870 RepID=M5UJI9_9BACT|nr:DNA mismatch repair protein MutT [Rhodopirellula sallentina]EMI58016.1 MutT/nudix family protein [Rhodopirellula sallentina SM41]
MSEEHVLVVPADLIESIGHLEGFEVDVDRFLVPILASDRLSYRPRAAMEADPRFKQLIPYVVMQWTDPEDGLVRVFTYTRGGGSGESRLHAKRSIGVGGHISQEDADGDEDPYVTGMRRELDEEVTILSDYTDDREGVLYDPSNEVGQVHLGVIHRFTLEQPNVTSNEPELAEGEFLTIAQLRADYDRLETWSQLCLDSLFPAS